MRGLDKAVKKVVKAAQEDLEVVTFSISGLVEDLVDIRVTVREKGGKSADPKQAGS